MQKKSSTVKRCVGRKEQSAPDAESKCTSDFGVRQDQQYNSLHAHKMSTRAGYTENVIAVPSTKSLCQPLPAPSASRTPHPKPFLHMVPCLSQPPDPFWSASVDPPITKSSLSELDLDKIISDPKLRHDLNFEQDVRFRPNYDGPRGEKKKARAAEYWDALAIEFAMYMERNEPCRPLRSHEPTTGHASRSRKNIPHRLPLMFETIREILETQIPHGVWSTVDQRFDVDLLMQQLEKGVCDLGNLSNWLGKILMGSCSPIRDQDVVKMVQTVQNAVKTKDARGLSRGIEKLFTVLETMKLDVANHLIGNLRPLLIDDIVQFEQNYFLSQEKRTTSEAIGWYDSIATKYYNDYNKVNTSLLHFATRAMVGLVAARRAPHATFVFDIKRLTALQLEFQNHMWQAFCRKAFVYILKRLGYQSQPTSEATYDLLYRISEFVELQDAQEGCASQSEEASLEIVRAAYHLCHIKTIPSDEHVSQTQLYLEQTLNIHSDQYHDSEGSLVSDVQRLVDEELECISDLTPLQIVDYFNPKMSLKEIGHQSHGLRTMAQRIAHISVLHWRTWSPILNLQSRQYDDGKDLCPCMTGNKSLADGFTSLSSGAVLEDAPRDVRSQGEIICKCEEPRGNNVPKGEKMGR